MINNEFEPIGKVYADNVILNESEMVLRLSLWKRFCLWVHRIRHRKHIKIWTLNNKERTNE